MNDSVNRVFRPRVNVDEGQFRFHLTQALIAYKHCWYGYTDMSEIDFVTGPGRSGAIVSVYLSHKLGVPYVPFKSWSEGTIKGKVILVADTVVSTGKTMRKAIKFCERQGASKVLSLHVMSHKPKSPIYRFWYEV